VKVLHIIDSGGLYGAEIMLLGLMEEQLRQGHHPVLASIGDLEIAVKPIEAEAKRRGLPVKSFRMRPGPNIVGAYEVLRFAWQEKTDILHSHGYKGNILFGFLPRWLRRMPMVATVHGWTWTGGVSRMVVYEWLDAVALTHLDRVVLVNEAMKGHYRLSGRRLPISVVENGISFDVINKDTSDRQILNSEIVRFCEGGYTLGAVGRLSREKGFDLLLEAFAGLVKEGRDIRLCILGEGGLRGELEQMIADLGISQRVLMPGFVDDARKYIAFFKLFAISSLTEGLPMVLLEAMLAGVPIVASGVGGIPYALDNGLAGLVIDPGSSEALKVGVLKVFDDQKKERQRVQVARERVADRFSSKAMAEKYLDIYKMVQH